jgi:VWFA-related protein
MKYRTALSLSILLLAVPAAASAEAGSAARLRSIPPQDVKQETQKQDAAVDVSVIAITIAVTVQTPGGRYVNDLEAKDFAIFENNKPRPLTYFRHDDNAPVSLTILLDVSGSMAIGDKLADVKTCLRPFLLSTLGPRDEAALLIFADGAVEVASAHTTRKDDIWNVLAKTEAYGKTALNDAVGVSPEYANKGKLEKRALILITDGVENDSEYSPEQALDVARRVDVPIYTIGYKIPLGDEDLRKLKKRSTTTPEGIAGNLERFSRATGGRAFFARTLGEMMTALGEIQAELGQHYLIGYTSYKSATDDYKHIRVTTPKKNLRVRTRMGY